jgi:hypothetical protein
MVYPKIINDINFINNDVLKKLLNGLNINNITIIIDAKEQMQIVFVSSLCPNIWG